MRRRPRARQLLAREAVGRRRLRRQRGVLLRQRKLTIEIRNPLGVLLEQLPQSLVLCKRPVMTAPGPLLPDLRFPDSYREGRGNCNRGQVFLLKNLTRPRADPDRPHNNLRITQLNNLPITRVSVELCGWCLLVSTMAYRWTLAHGVGRISVQS